MVQVEGAVRGVVALLVATFWSCLLLLHVAVQRLKKGAAVLQPTRRPRPAVLDDSTLGTHRTATVQGIKLHYVEKGDRSKPLLVLVHGFPAFWYCWHYQLKDLAKDYWVVAVDLRGYGESSKPSGQHQYSADQIADDVFHLLETLGRQSCVLVGHDWGGIIAYQLNNRHPAAVEKLVIINAPHPDSFERLLNSTWNQLFRSWYIYVFQLPWFPEQVLQLDDCATFDKMFRANPSALHHFPQEMIDAYKYTFSEPGSLTPPINYYRQTFGWCWRRGARPDVPRITCPLLVIWGEKDTALSPLLATMPSRYADKFTVRFLPEASHWSMMEEPEKVNGLIRKFVEGQ